ncbi:MAG: HlyD family secretion protein, partial [Parcubacteria group bacterium Athens1014_26]
IRNKVDQFFNNPRTSSPTINFSANSSQIKYDLESSRLVIESTLVSWNNSLASLTVNSDLSLYISNAKNNLAQIKSFLDEASLSINALTANSNLTQTTIDAWKAAVYAARTNIGTATTNLSTEEQSLNSAESDVTLAKNELILDQAGTVPEQILAQEANVEKAQANVTDYSAQLAKSIIRSPINGIVTAQNTKVGEIVSANTVVVSVISKTKFEMEASVAEADISKVKVGDFASVTLDAYGGDVFFDAKVTAIDPAETIIEGVATYKTTLQFISEDARVKSGMTANIDINTAKVDNVLVVPQRAIISKDGDKSVQILINNTVKEVPVKIGLRGSDGQVEIITGVKEGDKVVISQ